MEIGYIYILTNPSMLGLVKIGYTKNSPEERAAELYTTGVPERFIVSYKKKIIEPRKWEAVIHKNLSSYRKNKEWFFIDLSEAIKFIDEIIGAPAEMVAIYESTESRNILRESVEKAYEKLIQMKVNQRAEFLDFMCIAVNLFYDYIYDQAVDKRFFKSIFKKTEAIDKEKMDAIANIFLIKFVSLPTKDELVDQYIESHGDNLARAKRVAANNNQIAINGVKQVKRGDFFERYNLNDCCYGSGFNQNKNKILQVYSDMKFQASVDYIARFDVDKKYLPEDPVAGIIKSLAAGDSFYNLKLSKAGLNFIAS